MHDQHQNDDELPKGLRTSFSIKIQMEAILGVILLRRIGGLLRTSNPALRQCTTWIGMETVSTLRARPTLPITMVGMDATKPTLRTPPPLPRPPLPSGLFTAVGIGRQISSPSTPSAPHLQTTSTPTLPPGPPSTADVAAVLHADAPRSNPAPHVPGAAAEPAANVMSRPKEGTKNRAQPAARRPPAHPPLHRHLHRHQAPQRPRLHRQPPQHPGLGGRATVSWMSLDVRSCRLRCA